MTYDPKISETAVQTLKLVDPTGTGPYFDLSTSEIVAKTVGSLQVGFAVDTVSGSTANKQEWRSDGTPVASIDANGWATLAEVLLTKGEFFVPVYDGSDRLAFVDIAPDGSGNALIEYQVKTANSSKIVDVQISTNAGVVDGLVVANEGGEIFRIARATGNVSLIGSLTPASLHLPELPANGTNYIAFKAPDTLAGNVTWTWPSADAAGSFVSDGLGAISIGAFSLDPGTLSSVGGASGRVTYYTAADGIAGNANLTWDGTDLHSTGFIGPLAGAVTGNVTGNLTGDVIGGAGSFTGKLIVSDPNDTGASIAGIDATGTDHAGKDVAIYAGFSTGDARGGTIFFNVSKRGATGDTLNDPLTNPPLRIERYLGTDGETWQTDIGQALLGPGGTYDTGGDVMFVPAIAADADTGTGLTFDSGKIYFILAGVNILQLQNSTTFRPVADNSVNLGGASNQFAAGYFGGTVFSGAFRLNALQTAPANAGDTGTAGEIRFTDGYLYLCSATNTWLRAALATWT